MPGTLKRLSIATAVAACVGVATLPSAASAGPAEDLVGGVQKTVNDTLNSVNGLLGGGGGGAPAPGGAQPAPAAAELDPPITDTDPHAEGEVIGANIDLLPLTPGEDDVIVGQSRGEQDADGNYHGQVIPVSALGLGVGVIQTDEGESASSPLTPINDVLDDICTGSGNNVCLALLEFESTTTDSGSQNSFSAARANVGEGLVAAEAVTSEGNINETSQCQTAQSSSSAADLGVAGGAIGADVLDASSESEACNDGTETSEGDSQVLNLGSLDALDPLALIGCDSTAVDDEFGIPVVLDGVCNGDDTDGSQADAPYNIRKALGIEVLPGLQPLLTVLQLDGAGLLGVDATSAESLAQAPDAPEPECPDPDNPDCPGGPGGPNGPNGPDGPDGPDNDGGPGGPSADTPDDDLPFTGADMGTLGLIGLGVMAVGLALMALADRRRSPVQS